MLKSALVALASAGALVTFAAPACAQPSIQTDPNFIAVSGGCGPYGWRGPWGHCRNTPYHGNLPDGGWK